MASRWILMFLAVGCGVSAWSEERYIPPQARSLNTVLQNIFTGPEGDTTITVTGNVEFKETITVSKKKGNDTDHLKMGSHFLERCCNVPSNRTGLYNETVRECIEEVREGVLEEAANNEEARSDVNAFNCIVQCVSHKFGLSASNGSILIEEMTSFTLNDSRTLVLGITEGMVHRCIRDAKHNAPEIHSPNQRSDVCNTSNTEVLRFVKCISQLENIYCPANYIIQSKSCRRNREVMKRKLRERDEEKIHNY